MKRLLVVLGVASAFSFSPLYLDTFTPPAMASSVGTAVVTPPPRTTAAANKALQKAARATYRAALLSAQNGRDLAFADANATLMQSAGKEKATVQAARAVYKAAAKGIITAYNQAIATAHQNYQAALAMIGK
jgi:Ser/Thr protein kinase RdoA (MazF antagonist)